MNRRQSLVVLFAAAAVIATHGLAFAQQGSNRPLWGQEMLTEQERNQFHLEMRNAKTEQERLQIREQHQQMIHARARERGLKIPPATGQGQGMGQGTRQGQGMKKGQGLGQGQGMGQGMGKGKKN